MPPFSGEPDIISRASSVATTMTAVSEGSMRSGRAKANEFILKNGRRHHAYEVDKVPYPLAYETEYLDLEALQLVLAKSVGYPLSYVPEINGGNVPSRCLDLGCGQGLWVLAAAKEWTETEFVGFDLVNIQVPLKLMDESLANRVTWRHGNFMSNQLPFEDDVFDYVRMSALSRGIPENKWNNVLEEVHRVLAPGGVVELLESDISFPILPRWFTAALHMRSPRNDSVFFIPADERNPSRLFTSPTPEPPDPGLPHDHALLESLFYSVFENRFINVQPSAIIPSYFTTIFANTIVPAVRLFPTPPYTPFCARTGCVERSAQPPPTFISLEHSTLLLPPTGSVPSSMKSASLVSLYSSSDSGNDSGSSLAETPDWDDLANATEPVALPSKFHWTGNRHKFDFNASSGATTVNGSPRANPRPHSHPSVSHDYGVEFISFTQRHHVDHRRMFMHLYIAFQDVLACHESMWEELSDRLRRQPDSLARLGWHADEDLDDLRDREKYDNLFDRYCSDMRIRLSFSESLSGMGWHTPPMGPLSKAELTGKERLLDALKSARHDPLDSESTATCRTSRRMWGYKAV